MCINISLTLFFKTTTTKHFHCVRDTVGAERGSIHAAEGWVLAGHPFACSGHRNPGLRLVGRTHKHSHSGTRSARAASPKLGLRGPESSQILPDCIPHPTFASGRRSRTSFWSVPGFPGMEVPALSRSSSLTFQAANKN